MSDTEAEGVVKFWKAEYRDPLRVRAGRPRPHTLVDLGALDPRPQRLSVDTQLPSDPHDRAQLRRRITTRIDHHPDRPIPQLIGVLPRC